MGKLNECAKRLCIEVFCSSTKVRYPQTLINKAPITTATNPGTIVLSSADAAAPLLTMIVALLAPGCPPLELPEEIVRPGAAVELTRLKTPIPARMEESDMELEDDVRAR